MQLQFTGRNFDITPALKEFTTEKFERLEKLFKQISVINIIFRVEHSKHIIETTLHVDKAEIHITVESNDMYQAVDELAHKLQNQITKHKEKLIDHHREGT